MYVHVIEGEAGCRFAVNRGCVAVVVDALRASATAAMLLHAGAEQLLVVRTVDDAFAAKREMPDVLLFGERGGLPPDGFDFGNSPQTVSAAKARYVVFTTTTGAQRLVSCWGARTVYMGTTTNTSAVMRAATAHGTDIVVIPAGLHGDPDFNAQEDWVAGAYLAKISGLPVGEGKDLCAYWERRIEDEGLPLLFANAPHAEKLRAVHLESDISWCARVDVTDAVPTVIARTELGVIVHNAM